MAVLEMEEKRLSPVPVPDEKFVPTDWSPDGRKISGMIMDSSILRFDVAFYDLETNEIRTAQGQGDQQYLGFSLWLADSKRILFFDFASNLPFLWHTETGEVREIEGIGNLNNVPRPWTISSDNRTLFVERVQSQSDIWLLTLED